MERRWHVRTLARLHVGVVLLSLFIATVAYPVGTSDIEKQLMCTCGCTMVLASCQCGKAEEMRAEIQAKLDAGVPPAKIIQDFVAMYDETVLAAPTKRGFNLTAWVAPFGAIVAGLVLLYFVVRGFTKRGREQLVEAESFPEGEEMERFRERIDEELKEYM